MAKSPFAEKHTETYTYPAPLDPAKEEERAAERETLRSTNPDLPPYVSMIDSEVAAEDPAPWVKLRIPRAKSDVDMVADLTQSLVTMRVDGATMEQRIARGNRGVFELLCEGWSFDAEPNGANFARLDTWAADWISACLAEVVERGTDRGWAEKNGDSSTKRGNSRRKSPGTAAQG